MPGEAIGSSTRTSVWNLVAPRAYEPSRMPRGIARRASSVETITTGTVSRPSVRLAQRMPPVPKVGVAGGDPFGKEPAGRAGRRCRRRRSPGRRCRRRSRGCRPGCSRRSAPAAPANLPWRIRPGRCRPARPAGKQVTAIRKTSITVPKMAGNRPPSVFDSRGSVAEQLPDLAQSSARPWRRSPSRWAGRSARCRPARSASRWPAASAKTATFWRSSAFRSLPARPTSRSDCSLEFASARLRVLRAVRRRRTASSRGRGRRRRRFAGSLPLARSRSPAILIVDLLAVGRLSVATAALGDRLDFRGLLVGARRPSAAATARQSSSACGKSQLGRLDPLQEAVEVAVLDPFQHAARRPDSRLSRDGVLLDPAEVLPLRVGSALPVLNWTLRHARVGIRLRCAIARPSSFVPSASVTSATAAGQKTPRPLTSTTASSDSGHRAAIDRQRRAGRPDQRLALPPEIVFAAAASMVLEPAVPFSQALADQFRRRVQHERQHEQEHCT